VTSCHGEFTEQTTISGENTSDSVLKSEMLKNFVCLISKGHIRALALRVLAEFLRCHADRFGEYIELTIVRTLEAHKDPVKEASVKLCVHRLLMYVSSFSSPQTVILLLQSYVMF
jgi:hypothetical protein